MKPTRPSARALRVAALLGVFLALGLGGPAPAAFAVAPTSTVFVAPSGTATWAQILANAGVPAPALTPPVTTGGWESVRGDLGLEPPDTHGAAGPNHVVTAINGAVRIWTKTGQSLGQVSDAQFLYRLAPLNLTDPKIDYDPFHKRWIVSEDMNTSLASASVAFAISATDDPTGLWTFWAIDVDGTNTNWADHERQGFNQTWIAFANNMYPNAGGGFQGSQLLVVDKATALAGGTITVNVFDTAFDAAVPGGGGFMLSPAKTIGSEPKLYCLNLWGSAFSDMRMSEITGTGPAPIWLPTAGSTVLAGSGRFATATAYSLAGIGAPQSGTANLLSTGFAYRTQDVWFRDGRLWTAHCGGIPIAGPTTRNVSVWHELDPALMVATGAPEVQGGDTSGLDGALHHIYPSIAPNASRDAGMGFTRTDGTVFPGAAHTFRLVADTAGTMRPVVLDQPGLDFYVGGRWGDWSGTSVDPCDDLTFWTTQEFGAVKAGGARWSTWWQRFSQQPAPTITCPLPQVLEATGPTGRSVTLSFSVSAPGSTSLTLTLLEGTTIVGTATVPAGGPPTVGTPSITATYSLGLHSLTAVVADCSGATTTCGTTVTIADTTPPVVTATLKKTILWTARNALTDVGLTSSAVDLVVGAPTFVSTLVFSDEGHLTNPPGPDGTISGGLPTSTLRLRSQRKTNPAGLPAADGRVYLIVVRWTDLTNVGFAAKTVICPTAMTATKLAAANAQAAAALAFANANLGAPPAGYVPIVP